MRCVTTMFASRLIALLLLCATFGAVPALGAGSADAAAAGSDAAEIDDEFADEFADEFSDEQEEIIADPIEPFNRLMFRFNDKLYFYLLKPAARVYRVLPEPVRVSASNFFTNLGAPIRIVNSALQLKLRDAGNEIVRFGVNTTVGIGGLFDPARHWLGIRKKDEDFGQTLGRYGTGPGIYIVMPVLGPSTLRDGFGDVVDAYMDPVVIAVDDSEDVIALKAWETVNYLSLDKDTYESIKRDALDPYTFMKNAFAQNREGRIAK